MLGVWLAVGCPRPSVLEPVVAPVVVSPTEQRTPIDGPRYWSEPGGLCLEIPTGWIGTAGSPPLVLDLRQPDTGFGFAIRTWSLEGLYPPREGYELTFEDNSAYRTVPILAPSSGRPGAGTRTWEAIDPTGPMIQAWYGTVGERTVEVSATFPRGRATEGQMVIEPLLRAVCTTWR